MMLAWLSLALLAIGVKPQQDPSSAATAARADHSAPLPGRRHSRPVATGSLAQLVNDSRCAAGSALAIEINAAEDGLSPSKGWPYPKPTASWLSPLWIANASLQSAPAGATVSRRHRAAFPDGMPLSSRARLGWSGCTAFHGRSEQVDRLFYDAQRRKHASARWFSAAVAGIVGETANRMTPWLDRLVAQANPSASSAVRISRRPERAGPDRPQERAIPQGELMPFGKLTL